MSVTPPGKNMAVISYITFVGMIIAYFMNREDKHEFATWHIKNMFGLLLLLLIAQVSHAYVDSLVGDIFWWAAFIGWIFSLVMAVLNKKSAIPFLSEKFQTWFQFLN